MVLHQPGDIGVVFQNENGLAQTVSPCPAAGKVAGRLMPQETTDRVIQTGKGIANV
jgi:hypothetical protein